jgi:hypothetical protein
MTKHHHRPLLALGLVSVLAITACDPPTTEDAGNNTTPDASQQQDAGPGSDAAMADATMPDANGDDAGVIDAGGDDAAIGDAGSSDAATPGDWGRGLGSCLAYCAFFITKYN